MSITLVHSPIKDGAFGSGKRIQEKVKTDKDALAYYNEMLKAPVARRRGQTIDEILREKGGVPLDIGVDLYGDPDRVLATSTLTAARKAVTPSLFSSWNPFTTDFYQHIHENGASFSLGGAGKNVDMDVDLSQRQGPGADGTWNDQISSVDTGKFVIVTVLGEHAHFRGAKLIMFVDDGNLTDNELSQGVSWNDQASSAITGAVSLENILDIIKGIAG